MRQLCELQTVRAGIVSNRTEWKNRIGSGLTDNTATRLAAATIEHFTSQLEVIDRAIGETIDHDAELRRRRDLLLSVKGVGNTLAASLLVEMPEPGVLRHSGEIVAYAGLNPSCPAPRLTVPLASPRSAMARCGRRFTCRRFPRCASIRPLRPLLRALRARVASSPNRSLWPRCANSWFYASEC